MSKHVDTPAEHRAHIAAMRQMESKALSARQRIAIRQAICHANANRGIPR
jgi:hypothetical protein